MINLDRLGVYWKRRDIAMIRDSLCTTVKQFLSTGNKYAIILLNRLNLFLPH